MECKDKNGDMESSEEECSHPDRYDGDFWHMVVTVAVVQGVRLGMKKKVGNVCIIDGLDGGKRKKGECPGFGLCIWVNDGTRQRCGRLTEGAIWSQGANLGPSMSNFGGLGFPLNFFTV